MGFVSYYSVNGKILGEQPVGGTRLDYLTDALGSVTATVDRTGTVQNTYQYKPYGKLLARTGTASDPIFTWVGSQGYRTNSTKHADFYVRARHYGSCQGRWITKDPLPLLVDTNSYTYGYSEPTTVTDSSGLLPGTGPCSMSALWPNPKGRQCIANTKAYGDSFKETGNQFERCASCVSAFVCFYILACDVLPSGTLIPIGGGHYLTVGQLCACGMPDSLQCVNNCMEIHWRTKDTPRWGDAKNVCARDGQDSVACCQASILAEQDGLTKCNVGCGNPLLKLMPESLRLQIANDLLDCCAGSRWTPFS